MAIRDKYLSYKGLFARLAIYMKRGKDAAGSETGEAVIKVTITDSDNHTGKTAEIVIRITDKDTAEIKVSQDDSTYEEDLPDPKYDVPGDDDAKVTITYTGTLAGGTPYEATGEKPTEAGNYVVTVEWKPAIRFTPARIRSRSKRRFRRSVP